MSPEVVSALAVPAGCGMQGESSLFYRGFPGTVCGRAATHGGRGIGLKANFKKGLGTQRSPPGAQTQKGEGGDPV